LSFTKIWTLKEALLKAAGIGLVDRLNQVNVHEILMHYKLNFTSFACPHNETGSVVYSGMPCQKSGIRYFNLERLI
jgi:phosphopantetheinyl transferase